MLSSLMNEQRISLNFMASDYKSAICEAGRLLEADGCITAEYTEACVNTVREMGAYIVLADGLALPHARPEQGVLRTGISLVVLKEPVCFGHATYDPVKIIFCLAASDSTGHLSALQDIAMFALDRARFDRLAAMDDPSKALAYICEVS